ncbi:claudin-15-like isoform X1 [Erpetoichthys calabaricus]|uniref:claudin-15-like isoform X1 n=1 Tax=Erpetoichthys calabaricus TaxID=27687 RepID=UPI002234904C|nr:claudin-15-like isoform X1 [Erpetoichthys calabaricus]
MNSAVEALGLLLGVIASFLLGISLGNSSWRVSTVHNSVITTSTIYENLWMSCATDSAGGFNCWMFPSLLALSGYIQACRALMIAAIVMGVLGSIAALIGLQCTKVGGDNYTVKGRIAGVGGVLYILGGLCAMVAISWYAFNITREFFDPLYPGIKYEIGPALYIGWCAGTMAIFGGLCLVCSCKLGSSDKYPSYSYGYHPPKSTALSAKASQPEKTNADGSFYGKNAYV